MSGSDLSADLERYRVDGKLLWYEPSLWVIMVYRMGRHLHGRKPTLATKIFKSCHLILFSVVTLLTGIHLPRWARIGPGLRIWHFGGIIINPDTVIGKHCTLRHGVTIGTRRTDHDVPEIGDRVDIGAGAILIGNIRIGNDVVIGAGAVVISDVPDEHVAVGNPARAFPKRTKSETYLRQHEI